VRTALFCTAVDVADAGPPAVLDDALGRAGVDGLAVAASYHAARDLLPHARGARLRAFPAGLWIARDPAIWDGCPVTPTRAGDDATEAAVREVVAAAAARGATVDGWAVFMHVDAAEPGPGTHLTAFGDPLPEQLCPSRPAARAYAVALARAILRAGMGEVLAESLHHHGLEHGVHHERHLFEPGPVGRLLLGLCLCDDCVGGAGAHGADGSALRAGVRGLLQGMLDRGEPLTGEVETRDQAAALLGGELGALLDAREAAVTSLVAEVAAACREEGGALTLLDSSGAAKGYADGLPTGGPAVEVGWRFGLDVGALAPHCAVEAIAYARDPARVELDLAAYRAALGDGALSAIVRPFGPDCDDAANLRAKAELARAAGCRRFDLYHYGLMPLPVLDRIAAALG